jgi:hypothetical protein
VDIGNFETKALLFQAGYLTVANINKKVKPSQYYLRYPNLEVEAAMANVIFDLNDPFEKTILKRRQAKAALKFLTEGNALEFQKAMESILSDVNYLLHLPFEAYYQTIFQFVLELSGQAYDSEGPVGDGRYDLHFVSSAGDDYVVEIKYVKAYDDDKNKEKNHQSNKPSKVILKQITQELARLKAKMAQAAGEAMAQIDLKKYVNKFQGGNNKIYKVALIFGRRTQVASLIEQDKNWSALDL